MRSRVESSTQWDGPGSTLGISAGYQPHRSVEFDGRQSSLLGLLAIRDKRSD
ncbi:MAG: hypothetical protein VX346_14505 [Planctomycetota bacterium]|nr:hypothetical protein [Planctomycetota bacterium]